ncbi:lipoprotein [Lysinibacillus alkalisoli]|uniref:Lipoprotein n=1 Tax=Lysinibacillus alkalisoli TaxID=1911548 RepID=A0A917G6N2_9BACI|nr:MetQ/NlpA family ABC transporter substrate-binding protein [Lysinibacillus alkalisoli]GGG25779.1 lipoprotein [Lysinibacillus alkalisoli]
MKKFGIISLLVISLFALAACGKDTGAEKKEEKKEVVIGVTGTDGEQWNVLKELAEKEGITITLQEFSDYTLPNKALADGDIDLNSFQHIAFLSQFEKENNTGLVPIGATVIAPLGIYSSKVKDVNEVKEGDKVAIPDDPSNQGRALQLLQSAGLIKLADNAGLFADVSQITENKRNLDIIPMVAQQTPRALEDVTLSIINNGIAGQAGFDPLKDPIYLEDAESEEAQPYVNIFAAKAADKDNKVLQRIVELYHDQAVIDEVQKETAGGSIVVERTGAELEKVLKDLQEEK